MKMTEEMGSPCEDVLSMVVGQIDLGCSPQGNPVGFKVHNVQIVKVYRDQSGLAHQGYGVEMPAHTCRCFNPDRLASGQLGHLLDIREIKLVDVRPVVRREHVLLPRLPQQPLHRDLPDWQAIQPCSLVAVLLADPATVDQDRGRIALALQRCDNEVALVPVVHSRPDEHLLVMAETPRRVHSAVVEVVDGVGVDDGGQRQRFAYETVFAFRNEVVLPFQTLDLPCPEEKGRDGDESYELGCQLQSWVSFSSVGSASWQAKGVGGRVLRIMRPGPCLRPIRTSLGGASRIETNSGASPGCCLSAQRQNDTEKGLRAGRLGKGGVCDALARLVIFSVMLLHRELRKRCLVQFIVYQVDRLSAIGGM